MLDAASYDSKKSYSGGSRVNHNGLVYEAKWYANPDQSPNPNVQDWNTPWKLIGKGAAPQLKPVEATKPPEPAKKTSSNNPPYKAGTTYQPGDRVSHDGMDYQCKKLPEGAWCSGPAWAYAPGTGTAWDSAWILVGALGAVAPSDTDTKLPIDGDDKPLVAAKPHYMTQAELDAKERALTNSSTMKAVKASIVTRDNLVVEAVQPGRADNPDNVKRVEVLLNEQQFEYLFPLRAPEYSYRGLLQAVAKFPALCNEYDDGRDADAICRKTLATMFAHFAQETGGHESWRTEAEWRQALVHVREMGWNENARGGYNGECNLDVWQGKQWPCGTFSDGDFKSYFGRGAKQLSYNYNYGPFSQAMFGTVSTLLNKPELVADTWLNLASAVFFYIYPQPPKPSMLHVIDGTWQPNEKDKANGLVPGFGVTTQIINGGVECGGKAEHIQSRNRIDYYREFANYLNVPVPADEVLGCKGMKSFDGSGAGAVPIYWEQDFSWVAANPDGKSFACKLVSYQTPFSALNPGEYQRCVSAVKS
ncbi:glycoside hydrolase family 19 protein, partial [Aeromonas jandaei]